AAVDLDVEVPQYADTRNAARRRLQQLELLLEAIGLRVREPRDIAAGARERCGDTVAHRVGAARDHHDRYCPRRVARGGQRRGTQYENHIGLLANEVGCEIGKAVRLLRVNVLDYEVSAFDVPALAQPFHQRSGVRIRDIARTGGENADPHR